MKTLTVANITALFAAKNFVITDFNEFGIRLNDNLDKFTDIRGVLRKVNNIWELTTWLQTTKPALAALTHPDNPLGCAIIKEGQYIDCWTFGLHFGHDALTQCGTIKVNRYVPSIVIDAADFRKTIAQCKEYNAGPECGLNHHTIWAKEKMPDGTIQEIKNWDGTYPTVSYGGKWSEGCQCGGRPSEHAVFMAQCRASGQKKFSYSLFNISDIS